VRETERVPSDPASYWSDVDFSAEPRLLVGGRLPSRRLAAKRLRLHEEVFSELAQMCQPAMRFVLDEPARSFQPFTELETGEEYLYLDIADLPKHPLDVRAPDALVEQQEGSLPSGDPELADLVRLVRLVDGLDEIGADELRPTGLTFYAICWPSVGSFVGFISKSNPTAVLRPGLRIFQYGDALRRVQHPNVALTDRIDLVVGQKRVAILNLSAFTNLLADIRIAFEAVPEDLSATCAALATKIPMTPSAEASLRAESLRLPTLARRLHALPTRLAVVELNKQKLRRSMKRHGDDPSLLLDANGMFSFKPEQVGLFLDVVEGRYFEDDLTGERRRADRFRRR
jgi:hypothetical protein